MKNHHMLPFSFEMKQKDRDNGDIWYALSSLIVHIGTGITQGHYITLVKKNNSWVILDDEKVEFQNEKDLTTIYGGPQTVACAYILFFQKIQK